MPATVSADPDRLFGFVAAAEHVDTGLISEATALGAALDRVQQTCIDYRWPFPRLDRDLVQVHRDIDQLLSGFLDAALRFLGADGGGLWPELSGPTRDLFDAWGLPRSHDPLPPLATLLLLAGDPVLSSQDLGDIGHALAGVGGAVRPLVDVFGRLLTLPTTLLSSPESRQLTAQLAERLAETAAAKRVLTGVSHLARTPLARAAERGLTALTLFEDVSRLKRDGNPIDAWRAKGTGYVADVAGAGFDVTSAACAQAPSYVTCGAAATSGTVWAAAEAWPHRQDIVEGTHVTTEIVMAEVRRIRGLASSAVEEVGSAKEDLIREIRNSDRDPGVLRLPRFVTHALADTLETTGHLAGRAVDKTKHLVSSGWHLLGL